MTYQEIKKLIPFFADKIVNKDYYKGYSAGKEDTGKSFWTNVSDLIFITTEYNKSKAKKLTTHE